MSALQAFVAAAAVVALIVTGVVGLAGVWWACITAGVLIAAATVLLYDPAATNEARRLRAARNAAAGKRRP